MSALHGLMHLFEQRTRKAAVPRAVSLAIALTCVGPSSAWAATWTLPAATLPDRGRAVETVFVLERTAMTAQTAAGSSTARPALSFPFTNVRWGITDRVELSVAMPGIGLRVQVLDTAESAESDLPWHLSLSVHTDATDLFTHPGFGPAPWNLGGGLQVGVDGSADRTVGWRPTLGVTAQSADGLTFHFADQSSPKPTASSSVDEAQLSAILSQPRLHTFLLFEAPLALGDRRALTPGLGLDYARSIGEGALVLQACESCAVDLGSVSVEERLALVFSLRLEPRAGVQVTRRRD